MGLFLVEGGLKDTVAKVLDFLDHHDAYISETKRDESRKTWIKIKADVKFDEFKTKFLPKIIKHKEKSLIQLDVYPDNNSRILVGFKTFLFIGLGIFELFSFVPKVLDGEFSLLSIYTVISILFFLIGFSIIRDYVEVGKNTRLIETIFKEFLSKNYRVKVLSPIEGRLFPSWLIILIGSALYLCAIIVIFIFSKVAFIVVTPFFILSYLHLVLRKIGGRNLTFLWKLKLAEMNHHWLLANIYIITFLAMLYMFNFASFAANKNAIDPGTYNLRQGFNNLYFKPAFERNTNNFAIENAGIVKETVKTRIIKRGQKESYFKYDILINVAMFFSLIIVAMWLLLGKYRDILNISEYWKSVLAELNVVPIKQPSALKFEKGKKGLLKSIVLMNYLIAFPINYAAVIISLDALSYAFFEKTLIVKKTAVLFSWIPANFILLVDNSKINNYDAFFFVSKGILVLVGLPVILMIIRRISKFISDIVIRIYDFFYNLYSRSDILVNLNRFIEEVSTDNKIPMPKIRIKNSRQIDVSIKQGIFSKNPYISVSKGAIEKLNEKELKAMIVHEMGHIRQGLKKISLAKFLSGLSLLPNNILTLYFNFTEMEFEADEFCIKVTKDKKSLKDAILKVSILNFSIDGISKSNFFLFNKIFEMRIFKVVKEVLQKLFVLDEFFFGDMLIGYSHPILTKRIDMINNY